jgi:hypothetical protein
VSSSFSVAKTPLKGEGKGKPKSSFLSPTRSMRRFYTLNGTEQQQQHFAADDELNSCSTDEEEPRPKPSYQFLPDPSYYQMGKEEEEEWLQMSCPISSSFDGPEEDEMAEEFRKWLAGPRSTPWCTIVLKEGGSPSCTLQSVPEAPLLKKTVRA